MNDHKFGLRYLINREAHMHLIKSYLLLFACSFSAMASATQPPSSNYTIAAKFISVSDFSVCDMLKTYRQIAQLEKAPNLSETQRANLEMAKQVVSELDPPLNAQLNTFAANVAISVRLPSTLTLNRKNFFLEGTDGKQIGTFASDLLFELNDNDQVVSAGNGGKSFSINLTLAAFCPLVISGNTSPTVEDVLRNLIQ